MIITYEYSASDLAKKCFQCKWLRITDGDYYGVCECQDNKVKFRHRSVTDKACNWKERRKEENTDQESR